MIDSFESHVPELHPSAWVHPSAVVIGEVFLAAGVTVWPTAVLRGDVGAITIGQDSNLQDGVICHATGGVSVTTVGQRVTVGHRAVLHGCTVEDECLIGMGAMVLDGAVIGTGSFIGAGAVVPPGKKIPPHSLVLGLPAKVVGGVRESQRATIDRSWGHYRRMAERHG